MKTHKRLLGNAFSAAMQTVTSAFLLFFLYRYLLQTLGAEQLGVWSVVLASVSVGRLTDMGFAGTVLKFVSGAVSGGQHERASNLIQTGAISIVAALLVLFLIAFPLVDAVLAWTLPESAISSARQLLPIAFGSLLLAMVSGIFQSGLDACHKMYQKNILLVIGNVAYIGLTIMLVPNYGLQGVAMAQFAQSLGLLIASWFMLRRQIPSLPIIPVAWRRSEFREMLGYATNFQIGMVAGLLFDPLTKILLVRFGDLTLTAYFDMANQLVQKARAVVNSAQQALVPEIASIGDKNIGQRETLFCDAYGLSFLVIVPYYLGLAISLPFISWAWIGYFESSFVLFGVLMSAAWFFANLGAVSYFYNLGTAELFWNTINHLLTAFLNVIFGTVLGLIYSGIGVVFAAMLALSVPNLLLNYKVMQRIGVSWKETIPARHRFYFVFLLTSVTGLAICGWYFKWFVANVASAGGVIFGFAMVCLVGIAIDPQGRKIVKRIRTRLSI